MNIHILLILSLVGFGATGLIPDLINERLTGGDKNGLNELDSGLKIELEQEYPKLGDWVRARIEQGLDIGNSKRENVAVIIEDLLDSTVEVPKELSNEISKFLVNTGSK
ncbi:unnamed protein product [Caenorhabditis nigoni]